MKLVPLALIALTITTAADAQTRVRGYFRSDGTYVQPHVRSAPNGTTLDNWSTQPNVNPYTGQQGTRSPQPSVPAWQPYTPSQPTTPRQPPKVSCPVGSFLC